MTTIRNKQTGETLTGTMTEPGPAADYFEFRIQGTSDPVVFRAAEWDVLPPPLPTGIGAVAETKSGTKFIRLGANLWVSDANKGFYSDADVATLTPTILSPGVEL